MEQLPINNNGGQGYGFILYQTELPHYPKEIVMEQVLDRAQVQLDHLFVKQFPFGNLLRIVHCFKLDGSIHQTYPLISCSFVSASPFLMGTGQGRAGQRRVWFHQWVMTYSIDDNRRKQPQI